MTGRIMYWLAHEVWLLVTSAAHMPRAVGCFRRAGFSVAAYPVDFATHGESGPASCSRGCFRQSIDIVDDLALSPVGSLAARLHPLSRRPMQVGAAFSASG